MLFLNKIKRFWEGFFFTYLATGVDLKHQRRKIPFSDSSALYFVLFHTDFCILSLSSTTDKGKGFTEEVIIMSAQSEITCRDRTVVQSETLRTKTKELVQKKQNTCSCWGNWTKLPDFNLASSKQLKKKVLKEAAEKNLWYRIEYIIFLLQCYCRWC